MQAAFESLREATGTRHAGEAAPMLVPGRTCWRIEHADRVAFLVDGDAYFRAVRSVIAAAQRSIFILGWDFDSRMRLVPSGADDGFPQPLSEFLDAVVHGRPALHAYVLAWDFAMLYAFEREWLPAYQFGRNTGRVSFRLDNRHPLGACHHQKVVVVDDQIALLGGFDLTRCRWDTSEHAGDAPLRTDTAGDAYGPFHDVGAMVSGDCARALGDLARERWRRSAGSAPPISPAAGDRDHWPADVPVDLTGVAVGIVRTEPVFAASDGVTEIRALYRTAIAAARRTIFAENQYFTSRTIADALVDRLAGEEPPEIALVMPANQSGWLESSTMGVLRARLHQRLRAGDPRARYRLYCPTLPWLGRGSQCLNVHSKLMIVDDDFLTLGSANLSERSLSLDTECNIAIEARNDPRVSAAIVALRARLLAEHLGTDADAVTQALARERGLHRAIDALGEGSPRRLNAFDPVLDPTVDALTPDHDVLDPEKALDPDVIVADLLPARAPRARVRRRLSVIVAGLVSIAVLALMWRFTPLAGVVNFDSLAAHASGFASSPFAPLYVMLAYVAGGLLVIPLTLLIGVSAAVFGPLLGGVYAMTGALLSAAVTYAIGRRLGQDALRRFAGRRLTRLSERLGHRGLLTMVIVRLLPVAPYSMVNVVAGASHIGWRDYLLGTALGLLPGILGISLFVDRALEAIRHPGPVAFVVLAAIVGLLAAAGWMIRKQVANPSAPLRPHAAANPAAHAD